MAAVNQNSPATRKQSPVAQKAIAHYIALSQALNAQGQNQMLAAKRQEAQAKLQALGLPTRRDEDWQYTALTGWMQILFEQNLPGRGQVDKTILERFSPPFETIRLVWVDGIFAADLSVDLLALPAGLMIEQVEMPHAELASSDQPFELLHDALIEKQLRIVLKQGVVLEMPIELLSVQTQAKQLTTLSVSVQLEKDAQANLLQQVVSIVDEPVCVNATLQMNLADNAICKQYVLQELNTNSFYFNRQQISQQASSFFETLYVGLGAEVSRHENRVSLCGQGAEASQNSAVLGKGTQTLDSRTDTQHLVPYCNSQQLHKFVLDDKARGVFNGMIYVAPDAQKTDGQMDNKNLLLSNDAKMDTKPQLEIYADDVKCSHGCASGQIDENQIFYCQARGIHHQDAVQLITKAFLLEPLDNIANDAMRSWLTQRVSHHLA